MRKWISCGVCLLLALGVFAKSDTTTCGKAQMLIGAINKYHYKPAQLDTLWSQRVFDKWLDLLDHDRKYFTIPEIEHLKAFRNNLVNDVVSGRCIVVDKVTQIYEPRMIALDTFIKQELSVSFTFTPLDTFIVYPEDSLRYAPDYSSLQQRWKQYLKYRVLLKMFAGGDTSDANPETLPDSIPVQESKARKEVLKEFDRKFKRKLKGEQGVKGYVAKLFLNAIALSNDPHTYYMSPTEMIAQTDNLSAGNWVYGFSYSENEKGEIAITRLEPGSQAWKSNKLHEGDVLLKAQFEGKPPVDMTGMNEEEVSEVFKMGGNKVEITVRSPTGELQKVWLAKAYMHSKRNLIRSYVLYGDKKIGYISLPAFYRGWDNTRSLGCAGDVAKEIVKLQRENVDGLILNLRNNGGGSVSETMELAGIFIKPEAACITHRGDSAEIEHAVYRGTNYEGPLVVMVNGSSASASEVFAAVMREYNRAVILGSTTFGKATIGSVYPIDTNVSREELKELKQNYKNAFLHCTIKKSYHLDGLTHHAKGVVPDVAIPDIYAGVGGEKNYWYALPCDSISTRLTFNPLSKLPYKVLNTLSKQRQDVDSRFARITQINDSLIRLNKAMQHIPLSLKGFAAFDKERKQNSAIIRQSVTDSTGSPYKADYNLLDRQMEVEKPDTDDEEDKARRIKNINNDIYIHEAYRVMRDLIMLTKKR